jgi:DNA-binding response OmpR family regulator
MSTVRVLIVEDDPNIRDMYSHEFSRAGIQVFQASNGKDGIDLALLHHPDAILMDIMMPEMNGHVAVSKIRKDSWGKNAKVIFLTNMSDAENVVHAVEEGSSEYIIKSNMTPKEVVNHTRMAMRG